MSSLITPADRIFVAGHRGMAGSAICRALERSGYHDLITASRADLDLLDSTAVAWFEQNRPSVVVLAAGRVGGIQANSTYPANFLLENLKIQTNVITALALWGEAPVIFGKQLYLSEICPSAY